MPTVGSRARPRWCPAAGKTGRLEGNVLRVPCSYERTAPEGARPADGERVQPTVTDGGLGPRFLSWTQSLESDADERQWAQRRPSNRPTTRQPPLQPPVATETAYQTFWFN